jgi:hypothetical protein
VRGALGLLWRFGSCFFLAVRVPQSWFLRLSLRCVSLCFSAGFLPPGIPSEEERDNKNGMASFTNFESFFFFCVGVGVGVGGVCNLDTGVDALVWIESSL